MEKMEKYALSAFLLKARAKNLLDCKHDLSVSPEEIEIETLFNYILSKIEFQLLSSFLPKDNCVVQLFQKKLIYSDELVILSYSNISEYIPHYVGGRNFYEIIKKVADIFNQDSIPNYRAEYDITPGKAFITVHLENFY